MGRSSWTSSIERCRGSITGDHAASVLSPHAFEQRIAALGKRLEATGDVEIVDRGKRAGRRLISFRVDAPGYGLPTLARFEYGEIHGRSRSGWSLLRYRYEYRPLPRPSRRAYHLHRPFGEHQHCTTASGNGPRHFRAYRVDLIEALEEFERLHASRRPIECGGLRAL